MCVELGRCLDMNVTDGVCTCFDEFRWDDNEKACVDNLTYYDCESWEYEHVGTGACLTWD